MGKAAPTSHTVGNKQKQHLQKKQVERKTIIPVTSFFKPGTSATSGNDGSGICASISSSSSTVPLPGTSSTSSTSSSSCSGTKSKPQTQAYSSASSQASSSSSRTAVSKASTSSIEHFVSISTTLKAEILWVVKQITCHHSFKSSESTDVQINCM